MHSFSRSGARKIEPQQQGRRGCESRPMALLCRHPHL